MSKSVMEGALLSSKPEKLNARYTHLQKPKGSLSHGVSRPGGCSDLQNNIGNGLLYPPPFSLVNSYQHRQQQHKRPPPLLPPPITEPYTSLPTRTRGLSCSPTNKKFNTSMKTFKPSTSHGKEESKKDSIPRTRINTGGTTTPSVPLGHDPNNLPKDVSRVLSPSTNSLLTCNLSDLDKFSASIYTLSPPPSSLPLPKFSLRPKLGCYSKVATIDSGATDNLRQLFKLP